MLEKNADTGQTLRQGSPGRTGGLGGRKVAVSLNLLLLFLGAFVATNALSYVAGRQAGAIRVVPLVTEIRQFVAVQVTAPFDSQYSFEAWKLRDLLIEAGFAEAEVLGLDGARRLQVVAGKFDREDAGGARQCMEKLTLAVGRLRRDGRLTDRIPIEIDTIVISYRNRDAASAG
ncbi:MAG: hypothetical protein JXQ29_05515 [Planctomycetes bacterium]|nr:hypothetical protein [Planctomycetota bacterium]